MNFSTHPHVFLSSIICISHFDVKFNTLSIVRCRQDDHVWHVDRRHPNVGRNGLCSGLWHTDSEEKGQKYTWCDVDFFPLFSHASYQTFFAMMSIDKSTPLNLEYICLWIRYCNGCLKILLNAFACYWALMKLLRYMLTFNLFILTLLSCIPRFFKSSHYTLDIFSW